jgi:drug/metabolite transporter (DMT)-like permease
MTNAHEITRPLRLHPARSTLGRVVSLHARWRAGVRADCLDRASGVDRRSVFVAARADRAAHVRKRNACARIALAVVGVSNSALPFTLLAYASLSLTAGFNALVNATVPLWAAVIGVLWLRATMDRARWLGLALGVIGIAILTWGKVDFKPGGSGLAIVAGLVATLSYGFSTHFAKKNLASVSPLGVATGSQTAAAMVLAPLTVAFWPSATPSAQAWIALILLGIFSTALAYILYFRLIASLGGQKASTVTFLIPVFAALWGWALLDEVVTTSMWIGGAVVLLGTALTLGLIKSRA